MGDAIRAAQYMGPRERGGGVGVQKTGLPES